MSPAWRWFLPGYLWALPHTIVGLLIAILFYDVGDWRWSAGCIEVIAGHRVSGPTTRTKIWGQPWAQTHGFLIIYDTEEHRADRDTRVHERVHVVQGFIGGPLYVLAYGLCFLWAFAREFRDWRLAYAQNPFEVMAYERAILPAPRWGDV